MRRSALAVSLVGAALAGAVTAVAVRGGQAAPAAPVPPRLATATVVRTNLVTTALTGGTLGYAPGRPVINLTAGIYTWLPRAGTVVRALGVLYRVDDTPVTLMAGATPAWRPFALWPLAAVVCEHPEVCQMVETLISEIVGVPVKEKCSRKEAPKCCFEVSGAIS